MKTIQRHFRTMIGLAMCVMMASVFISCDNRTTQAEYAEDESIYGDRSDEALRIENEGIPDTTDMQDTTGLKAKHDEVARTLPSNIYNIIKSDSTMKNQMILESREYEKDNVTYYEVLFRHDNKITPVTFDKDGNRQEDYDVN
ncbi:hypothetical protein MM213_09920 [Belliella sp. R4-6]|uniref:Lipoprotein n=1 Tax=Belliella alkalica TaxID=1730871 RepID=A0ABS9VBK4_9BACT|nr:hypothetical protein [Belliella alkalica]MCH7413801.1 hypothetical protein [Belliella alkalica]